jgi:Protein of unknown function (DUF3300)
MRMWERKTRISLSSALALALAGSAFSTGSFAQDPQAPPPQSQYPQAPPPQSQYPPPQYPQTQPPPQYPQTQPPYPPQYPPAQSPYPPQYPPAQSPYPPAPPPYFPPQQLDSLVSRIALYPDSLLSQVLAASTFYDQIPDAARWADQHHYLTGDALAAAIQADHLPFDPSVQALLPFPQVLDMMASDMGWTQQMGTAFLANQGAVMDAVQRERQKAYQYGYLRSNAQMVVTPGPYIVIAPVNPAFIYVPVYNPVVVFAPPRPGIVVGAAIGFGWGFNVTAAFRPFGWGLNSIAWNRHVVIVNNVAWNRTWANRATYVHPYSVPRYAPAGRVEGHALHEPTPREREAYQKGKERVEEHDRRQ